MTACFALRQRRTSLSHSNILTSPLAPGAPCPATANRARRELDRASGSARTIRRGSAIVAVECYAGVVVDGMQARSGELEGEGRIETRWGMQRTSLG